MRQRLAIIMTVVLVVGVFVLLNVLNYAPAKQAAESELMPDRSTYNSGPTGTRAFYDLLSESGYKVGRWREPYAKLAIADGSRIGTFVIIGTTLRPISADDARSLLSWVKRGGRLLIIDRAPTPNLLPKSGLWTFSTEWINFPEPDVDTTSVGQMTEGSEGIHSLEPTMLTRDVQSVRPSRYASVIKFSRSDSAQEKTEVKTTRQSSPRHQDDGEDSGADQGGAPPAEASPQTGDKKSATAVSPAPVVHAHISGGALLLDYPHGKGRIVVLSDPYIFSNSGLKLADNLQLALNMVATSDGLIAFDEYHQGHAASENPLVAYFAGTPILAICGQLVLLILAIVWTRGRRFGRPLPLPQVDRRSSLEFVASMAELQQSARALDLALENIYSRTRRVLTRYAGVDYHSSRSEIAERVASRSSLSREQVESLMRSCEETINGAPINERQSIELVGRLRELESSLGLRMRSRETRQAAENI